MGGPGRFERGIGPQNLLGLVRNTAPYLFERPELNDPPPAEAAGRLMELGGGPTGWLEILRHGHWLEAAREATAEQRQDYFALCLACHHATVGTYVPTDVDTKIRAALWQDADAGSVQRMLALALESRNWDVRRVSARAMPTDSGPISGHDGERLSVLAGALGACVRLGLDRAARTASEAVDLELHREAAELERAVSTKDEEIRALCLASILTHNAGDLDQGMGSWRRDERLRPYRERFGRLAHENARRYDGAFQLAGHVYGQSMAAEGHRNYPLREVRALRRAPELLLPISPFLESWGARIAVHAGLSDAERAEVLAALLSGCKKIPGQVGYKRAIAGMVPALGGRLDAIVRDMPASLRQELKDPEVRRHIALRQASFESSMRKKLRALLQSRPRG